MRMIVAKYNGECRECGAAVAIGDSVVYEKRVGVFCPDCAPVDPEEVRRVRTEAGERKAAKYDGWAEKRVTDATAVLERDRVFTDDHAFNTQPGHIPERARVIARSDRAFESLNKAREMSGKADRLRGSVRVKGDADTKRQAKREIVLGWIEVGMNVDTAVFGCGVVEKVNKKTAKVGSMGCSGTWSQNVDLSFLRKA